MKIYHLFLILLVSFGACKEKDPVISEVDQGDQKGVLKADFVRNLDMIVPDWIEVIEDSMMLIVDRVNSPSIILYSLPQFKIIASTGNRGNGPFEFMTPKIEGRYFKDNDSLFVYISDTNAHNFFLLNITQLAAGHIQPLKLLGDIHPDIALNYLELYPTGSFTVIGTSWGNDGRIFLWDRKMYNAKYLPAYPYFSKHTPTDLLGNLYYSYSAFNSEKRILGSAMKIFKEVDFFNDLGQVIRSVRFNDDERAKPDLIPNAYPYPAGQKIYFARSYATKEHFYTTCENTIVGGTPSDNFEIYLFNWEAEFIGRWKMDRFNLGQFAVSEELKTLYMINYTENSETYPIMSYDISAVIP